MLLREILVAHAATRDTCSLHCAMSDLGRGKERERKTCKPVVGAVQVLALDEAVNAALDEGDVRHEARLQLRRNLR